MGLNYVKLGTLQTSMKIIFYQNFETLLKSFENKLKKPGHLINSLKPKPNGSSKNVKIAQH